MYPQRLTKFFSIQPLHLLTLSALLISSLFASQVSALPTDREEPIYVEADAASIDDAKGITVYTGSVKITQGSMILKGDRVELYRDDAGDINQIISLGKPAHFQQQPQLDQKVTYATGNKLDYTVSSQFLVITDDAKVTQGADSFTGAKINYDMANAKVKAFSDSDSNKRVQMVLQPRSDKKK